MSRIVDLPVLVDINTDGNPVGFTRLDGSDRQQVRECLTFHREWIGVLRGEPERDIWRLETERGICILHGVRSEVTEENTPASTYLLHAWED